MCRPDVGASLVARLADVVGLQIAARRKSKLRCCHSWADYSAICRQTPANLPSLQTKLSSGVSGLAEFCRMAAKSVPNTAGQKDIRSDIAKIAIEPCSKRCLMAYPLFTTITSRMACPLDLRNGRARYENTRDQNKCAPPNIEQRLDRLAVELVAL
jgi:hypothetical protein